MNLERVYKKTDSTQELIPGAQRIVEQYFNLNLGDKKVPTPYFMNEDKSFRWRRVQLGKGTPEEIEKEVIKLAQQKNFNLAEASVDQIREFMVEAGIGIDCSGFVVWVLNEITQEKFGKNIWQLIDLLERNVFEKLRNRIRPVENIGAAWFASSKNSHSIPIVEALPGDLLITTNNKHVTIISKVVYDKEGTPVYLEYINSKVGFGMRKDLIIIKNPKALLPDQEWVDLTAKKHFDESIINEHIKSSRLVRLNIFS